MAGSSPLRRRSYQWSSPQSSSFLSEYSVETRNSEERHKALLENAAKEHERVRADAERKYAEYKRQEEHRLLREEQKRQQDRLRLEAQIAHDRAELEKLKAKSIQPPPPPSPSPARKPPSQPATPQFGQPARAPIQSPAATQVVVANGINEVRFEPATRSPTHIRAPSAPLNGLSLGPSSPAANSFSGSRTTLQKQQTSSPTPVGIVSTPPTTAGQGRLSLPKPGPSPLATAPAPAPAATIAPLPDRYVAIHQNLKKLRAFMADQAKSNRALKARMGDMRREIRKCVGQLTGGRGANTKQTEAITSLLRESLSGSIPSAPVDPHEFLLEPRSPVDGAVRNEPQLPSLFLYLLNIFSKAAMSQWANEGSAKPETAGPVGVVVVGIFAEPEFLWRGASLIDMMIAKFRVACPVLFGLRGSERTQQGRQRLGWKKEGGEWISDQQHYDGMAGLGAGFAAIALRSFGKSKKRNPYPPTHYWTAMARIVDTPGAEISNSQCVVLKAMIANVETKFLAFYGNAALAALRAALVEFPAKAAEKTAASTALSVHAEVLRKDLGLFLD